MAYAAIKIETIIIARATRRAAMAVTVKSEPQCLCTWPDTPSIAADTEPTVTAMFSQCRNVRSFAAQFAKMWTGACVAFDTRRMAQAASAYTLQSAKCSQGAAVSLTSRPLTTQAFTRFELRLELPEILRMPDYPEPARKRKRTKEGLRLGAPQHLCVSHVFQNPARSLEDDAVNT